MKKLHIVMLCLAVIGCTQISASDKRVPHHVKVLAKVGKGPRRITVVPQAPAPTHIPAMSQDSAIEHRRMSHLPSADLDEEAKETAAKIKKDLALLKRKYVGLCINKQRRKEANTKGSIDRCVEYDEQTLEVMDTTEREMTRLEKNLELAEQIRNDKKLKRQNANVENTLPPRKSDRCILL